MKKIGISIIIIISIVLFANTVTATSLLNFNIELISEKKSANPGDEITVILRVKDFQNITEGIYAFLATIEYDNEFFEEITESSIKGLETWSNIPTFNPDNGQITADNEEGVFEESEVFSITFKIKDTVEVGESTEIVVKNFKASEGEGDLVSNEDAKITINIAEESSDVETNNDNSNKYNDDSNNDKNNNSNNNNNNNNNDSNEDDTIAKENLPQAGKYSVIMFSIIGILAIVASCGYICYKKYNKI